MSQLRGFVYREKRNARPLEDDQDRVIRLGKADDSRLYQVRSHTTQLYRNGTIEYLRDGVVGVVDTGGTLQVKPGFEDYDQSANYLLAADLVTTKSGERAEILGDDHFVHRLLEAGCRINQSAEDNFFRVTNVYQAELHRSLEKDYSQSHISSTPRSTVSHHQPKYDDDHQQQPNSPRHGM